MGVRRTSVTVCVCLCVSLYGMFEDLINSSGSSSGDDRAEAVAAAAPPGGVAAAAPPVAAHAAAAPAAPPGVAAAAPPVAAAQTAARLKMQLGNAKSRISKLRKKAFQVIGASIYTFGHHVSSVCFGRKQPQDRSIVMLASGGTTSISLSKHGRRTTDHDTCLKYGLVSAVHAQATGLAAMIDNQTTSNVEHIIAMNEFDDAGMWVQDPATKAERASGERVEGARLRSGRLWTRGQNIFLPVCNMCEHLFSRRLHVNGVHTFSGADVHSPSRPLCKANAGTIADRWSSWSACLVSGSGTAIDPNGTLNDALCNSEAWRTIVVNKDNLYLNRIVVGIQQQHIADQLRSGVTDSATSPTLLNLSCMGHSCVLSTKPVVDALDGLPSKWVRMGHLHESGKVSADHVAIVKAIVEDKFQFHPVAEYPYDFEAWQAKTATILRLSRPAMDLTPDDEAYIMAIDNGDWDQEYFDHWCRGERFCKVCKGNPDVAKAAMVTGVLLVNGQCGKTPLGYRWKGVEAFACKLYRGMRQHKIWLFSHRMLYPKAKTAQSQAIVEAAGGDENVDHSSQMVQHKTRVRGGKTVDMLEEDENALEVEYCLCLNSGVQAYLNKCFAADAAVSEYLKHVQFIPSATDAAPSEDILELRSKCIRLNLDILLGKAADELLAIYSSYFDFTAEVWKDWRLDVDMRFNASLDMVVVMQDAAYRLIHKLNVPEVHLLEVCRLPEGSDFSEADVRRVALPIQVKRQSCEACVDLTFTGVWLDRLLNMGSSTCQAAHRGLCDVVSVLRVITSLVEKKHLLGQELRPSKRGRGVKCEQLGSLVLKKSLIRASDAHRQEATAACLSYDKDLKFAFSKSLGDHVCTGRLDRRAAVPPDGSGSVAKKVQRAVRFDSRLNTTNTRGIDVYMHAEYSDNLEGDTPFAKSATLRRKWGTLSDDQKAAYSDIASSQNDDAEKHRGEDYVQFVARCSREGIRPAEKKRGRFTSDRFRAIQVSIQKMMNHKVYRSGAQLHEFDCGVRADLIKSELTGEQVSSMYKDMFHYDHKPVSNPAADVVSFPCSQLYGGMCEKAFLRIAADHLTSNLCNWCKGWKGEFPIVVQFVHHDFNEFCFIARVIGSKLAFLSRAVLFPRTADRPQDCLEMSFVGVGESQVHFPVSSHMYFADFVTRAAMAITCDPEDVKELALKRWGFERDDCVSHFRVRLTCVSSETTISSAEVAKSKQRNDDAELPFGLGSKPTGLFNARKRPVPHVSCSSKSGSGAASSSDCKKAKGEPLKKDKIVHHKSRKIGSDDSDDGSSDCGRSWSSDSCGQEQPGDAEPEHDHDVDADGPPLAEWNDIGLKCFEIPKVSKSKCAMCDCLCKSGDVRFDYRWKKTNSLRDQTRIHPSCLVRCPAVTRDHDVQLLRYWIRDPSVEQQVKIAARHALAALRE